MATTSPTIEANLSINIERTFGPEIADADHVRNWLCADGAWLGAMRNGFTFEVCPLHAQPDECECDGEVTIYAATIVGADWDD